MRDCLLGSGRWDLSRKTEILRVNGLKSVINY